MIAGKDYKVETELVLKMRCLVSQKVLIQYYGSDLFIAMPGCRGAKKASVLVCRSIIAHADSDNAAHDKLMEYFWGLHKDPQLSSDGMGGTTPPSLFPGSQPSLPQFKNPENCYHEWIEVTLFVTPQLRCKHCDIKKPNTVE